MYESGFLKFREVDKVIHTWPYHASDYIAVFAELDSHWKTLSAEEKLNLTALKLLKHRDAVENHAGCNLCKVEPIWIRKVG